METLVVKELKENIDKENYEITPLGLFISKQTVNDIGIIYLEKMKEIKLICAYLSNIK